MSSGWKDSLASGVGEIDSRKAELFALAEKLAEAARGQRTAEAHDHVTRLTSLARVLFEEEERMLREGGLPSLERHTREHRRFLSDLGVFARELGRRGHEPLADLRVARHVAAWLEAHVGQTDRDLPRR
jgi:hemerythrin-like metal-binding protein